MPITISGAQAAVAMLNRAFNDVSPSNIVYVNMVNEAAQSAESLVAFAIKFGNSFSGLSNVALADKVLANMGLLPNLDLQIGLTDYFAVNQGARGLVVLQLGQILLDQEFATGSLLKYRPAAVAWNKEVQAAFDTSMTPGTIGGIFDGQVREVEAAMAYEASAEALKTAIDAINIANETVTVLSTAATLRAAAKVKADATDALTLAGTGSTLAATAATLDDLAYVNATAAFADALAIAYAKGDEAKLAAESAFFKSDALVTAAARTLTTAADDSVAATAVANATSQMALADAMVESIRVLSVCPVSAPSGSDKDYLGAGSTPLALVGVAGHQDAHLLFN
jgi:hypothetical protein